MRAAWFLFAGLGLIWVSCGDASSSGDLFMPGTTGGSQGATGSGGSGTAGTSATTGAAGSNSGGSGGGASVGTGGSGTGGQATGAGGSGGSGTGGAGMTGGGGAAGSGGSPAGAGGTTGGDRGGSGPGGAAGTAGTAGNGGAPPDGGGGSGIDSGGPLHPIRCGTITCSAPGEFCCIPINNQIPRCVATGGACPANADRVACDDRTDCPALQICCAENPNGPGVADCRLPINCDALNAGQQLCDPQQIGGCFMPGLTSCMLDLLAIIPRYAYCH